MCQRTPPLSCAGASFFLNHLSNYFQGVVLVLGRRSRWYKAAGSALSVGDGKDVIRSLRLREPIGRRPRGPVPFHPENLGGGNNEVEGAGEPGPACTLLIL